MASSDEGVLVRIKTEPLSPTRTMQQTNGMSVISVKKELGGRLASFKPPRDLSLSAANSHMKTLKNMVIPSIPAKKAFVPNVNVTRRKAQTSSYEPKEKKSEKPVNDTAKRNNRFNKATYIQTQGVFSEGLTSKTVKPTRDTNSRCDVTAAPRLDKPKLNLNKNTDKKKEDARMSDILKDDFLDDRDLMPDLRDAPISLPLLLNSRERVSDDVDSTFEALQIKSEKFDEAEPPLKMMRLLEPSSSPQLFVFDFPPDIMPREIDKKTKKEFKHDKNKANDASLTELPCDRLSKLGEGQWGTLKLLANGNAYMAVGSEKIPVHLIHFGPKQTVMSVKLDVNSTSKGELINVGRVTGNFVCSSDLNLDDTKLK